MSNEAQWKIDGKQATEREVVELLAEAKRSGATYKIAEARALDGPWHWRAWMWVWLRWITWKAWWLA